MMTNKDSSAVGSKPIISFIRTRPAESKIQATLLGLNNTFPFVEKIIKEYTRQRPIHIQEACFEHTKKCFEDRVIPFLDMFKIHVMHCELQEKDDTIRHLHAEKDILETEIAQLKEGLTSLKIQNDGYKSHNPLPAKSVKARRAADYYRNLYVDISQFLDRSTKSVHTKPHQAKRVVNTSTNSWNETKNIVARIVPIWKPTDSAIARLVPMGYLASFTDEILV
nr:hypothetical protein [Tanacetum cinerariifolium]